MSTIITRNSANSGSVPSSLVQGELAINVTDGRLFYGSGSGNVVKEFTASGSGGGTINTGSFVTTSSFNAYTGSNTSQFAGTASYALTASFVQNAISASYVLSASYAATASFVTASNVYGPYGSNSVISSSYASASSISDSTTQIDVYVKNQSGAPIAKGVVVRITGSNNSSDIPRITTASYENDNNSANTLGITTTAIANGDEGYVITEGVLLGIDTQGFDSGQLIYLGPTGSIIGYAPVAPLHAVRLGEVIRQQSNNGSIYVRIDNGYELDELHNVYINTSSLAYGDLLMRSSSVWVNTKQLSGSYGLTGSLNATSFTGSLFGTASYASQALSSSYSVTASYLTGTVTSASFATTAISSSYPIAISGTTIYSKAGITPLNFNTTSSIFLGSNAGYNAPNANNSNFLGVLAGASATNAYTSNFIGISAGASATNAYTSNFIGISAGASATNANTSNFIGHYAGYNATNANTSNFIGNSAGYNATNANNSNFLGFSAGTHAASANNSNFLGFTAGGYAASASYSTFLGFQAGYSLPSFSVNLSTSINIVDIISFDFGYGSIYGVTSANTTTIVVSGDQSYYPYPYSSSYFGLEDSFKTIYLDPFYYQPPIITNITYDLGLDETTFTFSPSLESTYYEVTSSFPGMGRNNIVIGTNVGLPNNTQNAINIGGIIFGSGSYFNSSSLIDNYNLNSLNYTGSANGKIGINQPNPQASLDVYGSVLITGSLFVSQSLNTSARILYDSTGINTSIDWANRQTIDAAAIASIDWNNRKLYSSGGVISLDWTSDTILNSGLYQRNEKETNKQEIISDTINDPDNSYLGDIISVDGINTFIDGTVNDGMLVYLGTDATWYPVTQNSTTATKMLGIAFKVSLGEGFILLDGHVVITDTGTGGPHVTGADHGLPIYIEDNTTTGQMSTTLPTTTGGNHVVRVLGHCYWQNLTTTSQWMMKFRPSNDWITI